MPATCLENWDMLALLHLLRSNIFASNVRTAVCNINEYTRRDMAHERLDCCWERD